MRGVFERIVRGIAVVTLLVVLIVPAAYGDGEMSTTLDARMRPPIGATGAPEEMSFWDWALIWAELGLLSPAL
jgi:hypothetical protein